MKVDIKSKAVPKFKAYQVIFTIETHEESRRFHDDVAIKITDPPRDFISEIFERRDGDAREDYHGER